MFPLLLFLLSSVAAMESVKWGDETIEILAVADSPFDNFAKAFEKVVGHSQPVTTHSVAAMYGVEREGEKVEKGPSGHVVGNPVPNDIQFVSAVPQSVSNTGTKDPFPVSTNYIERVSEKGFKCLSCKRDFTTKGNAKKHVEVVHFKQKNIVCLTCGRAFADNRTLIIHLGKKKGCKEGDIKKKTIECSQCEKLFVSEVSLRRHNKVVHEGVKEFPCKTCNKKFGQKQQLIEHWTRKGTGKDCLYNLPT